MRNHMHYQSRWRRFNFCHCSSVNLSLFPTLTISGVNLLPLAPILRLLLLLLLLLPKLGGGGGVPLIPPPPPPPPRLFHKTPVNTEPLPGPPFPCRYRYQYRYRFRYRYWWRRTSRTITGGQGEDPGQRRRTRDQRIRMQ